MRRTQLRVAGLVGLLVVGRVMAAGADRGLLDVATASSLGPALAPESGEGSVAAAYPGRAFVPLPPADPFQTRDLLAQRVLDDLDIEDEKEQDPASLKPKNPFLALGLSAVIPGTGQLYLNHRNLSGYVFLGIEAAAWYLKLEWEQEGEDLTKRFEEYSFQGALHPIEGAPNNDIIYEDDANHWSWGRWRDAWQGDGTSGECTLPGFGGTPGNFQYTDVDSQLVWFWFNDRREFYEDIGKYDKYQCGWVNPGSRDTYSSMRAEANDTLDRASTMSQVILLNHLVSSVHAYFMTKRHNKRVAEAVSDVQMHFRPDRGGGLQANVVYSRRFF